MYPECFHYFRHLPVDIQFTLHRTHLLKTHFVGCVKCFCKVCILNQHQLYVKYFPETFQSQLQKFKSCKEYFFLQSISDFSNSQVFALRSNIQLFFCFPSPTHTSMVSLWYHRTAVARCFPSEIVYTWWSDLSSVAPNKSITNSSWMRIPTSCASDSQIRTAHLLLKSVLSY